MEDSPVRLQTTLGERLLARLFKLASNVDPENQVPQGGTVHEEHPDLPVTHKDKDPDFIYDRDLQKFPIGFSRFARTQNYYHNGSIHRRFGGLSERLLLYLEATIARREARLLELDKEDEARNSPMLFCLSPAQAYGGLHKPEDMCEKDRLLAETISLYDQYKRLLLYDVETRKLHRIEHREFLNHLDTAKEFRILEGDAKDFLNAPHDFVTTRPQRLHDSLERLVFGDNSRWFKKLFETDAPEGSPYQDHFDTRWFRVLSVLTFALLGLFLFILPVTILYFLEPGKEWSAGLVVMFALVFTVILSLVPRIQLETILIALATYVAIMVAFLASFQGGQCQCLVST